MLTRCVDEHANGNTALRCAHERLRLKFREVRNKNGMHHVIASHRIASYRILTHLRNKNAATIKIPDHMMKYSTKIEPHLRHKHARLVEVPDEMTKQSTQNTQ
jgi:hypothetical protein